MRRLLLLAGFAVAGVAAAAPPVDLDTHGVLESLRAQNRDHYAAIAAIVAQARARPAADVATWMHTALPRSEVEFLSLWQVSDPPRTRLSFTLDETRYTMTLVDRTVSPNGRPEGEHRSAKHEGSATTPKLVPARR